MAECSFYLFNNKEREPEFAAAAKRVAERYGRNFYSFTTLDLCHLFDRRSGSIRSFSPLHELELRVDNCFFIRGWDPSAEATALFTMVLSACGIATTDETVHLAHDIRTSKISLPFQLAPQSCATLTTLIAASSVPMSFTSQLADIHLGFPLVLKAQGRRGQRVWLCRNNTDLHEGAAKIFSEGDSLLLLQEYIETECDLRVFVHHGEVIAAFERRGIDGFLHNVSTGGTATLIDLSHEESCIARRAAEIVGLDLAGVDLIRTPTGPLVLEVNKSPGLCAFTEPASEDLATTVLERYLDHHSR